MIGAARVESMVGYLRPGQVKFEADYMAPYDATRIGHDVLGLLQSLPGFKPGEFAAVRNDFETTNIPPRHRLINIPAALARLVDSNEDELTSIAESLDLKVVGTIAKINTYDRYDVGRLGMHRDPSLSMTSAIPLLGMARLRTPHHIGRTLRPGNRFLVHTGIGSRFQAPHNIAHPTHMRIALVTRVFYDR